MEYDLILNCENGCSLSFTDILFYDTEFSAEVIIKSNWYVANLNFTASNDRLKEFLASINRLLLEGIGIASFINDNGNIDLEFHLDKKSGRFTIKGILIENMMDESRLEYSMQSDYYNLQRTQQMLNSILNSNLL